MYAALLFFLSFPQGNLLLVSPTTRSGWNVDPATVFAGGVAQGNRTANLESRFPCGNDKKGKNRGSILQAQLDVTLLTRLDFLVLMSPSPSFTEIVCFQWVRFWGAA